MRNKLISIIFSWFTILILLFGTMPVSAEEETKTVGEAQSFIDGIVGYQLKETGASSVQQWIDNALTKQAGISSEWYTIGLSQYGAYDFSNYETALKVHLSTHEERSASSRQKYALALAAAGSTDQYIYETMQDSIGQQGVMSWIYGLHLLNNGYTSHEHTLNSVKETLLSLQLADGGWAVMGTNADVDVTAMAVQALAPHYKESEVEEAVDNAIKLLSERQLSTGDYASYGVGNPESTAQVLVALSTLGIDCQNDERFIKEGNTLFDGIQSYRLEDGVFCHKQGEGYSEAATVQVFCSMVAYQRMINNKNAFYILDAGTPDGLKVSVPTTSPTEESEITETTEFIENNEDTEKIKDAAIGQDEKDNSSNYKLWVSLGILLVACGSCIGLYLMKKRDKKNYILIVLIALLSIMFVFFTEIQTPKQYYDSGTAVKKDAIGTVTLTIRCDTISNKSDNEWIPEDGTIFETAEYEIEAGDTVYDILKVATAKHKIHLETNGTAESIYVEGINHIYEFAYGELSGWLYQVNGETTSVGCNAYELKDGDQIEWLYSCEMGKDIR